MKRTKEIYKWLNSRGGRTTSDLSKNKEGAYVLMGNGFGKKVKVYLPKDLQRL